MPGKFTLTTLPSASGCCTSLSAIWRACWAAQLRDSRNAPAVWPLGSWMSSNKCAGTLLLKAMAGSPAMAPSIAPATVPEHRISVSVVLKPILMPEMTMSVQFGQQVAEGNIDTIRQGAADRPRSA